MVHLPVLRSEVADGLRDRLARDLAAMIAGPVWFDAHHRMLYATDASLYQVEPLGVVAPADAAEAERVLKYCAQQGVPVLPRCGGTSLAGQCTNAALVMDLSQLQRRVLSVDAVARRCVVEPGITVDELNRQLAPHGLMFAADPATTAQAGIGGCIGNNAAGARSIKYGRTSENVAAVKVALTGGRTVWLGPGAGRKDATALELARPVAEIVRAHAGLIRERFPKTVRRNAGYGLDLILKQMDAGVGEADLDLSGLICGSEGTLGVVVEAELKLWPVPGRRELEVLVFATVEEAIGEVAGLLRTGPSAVELLDDVVLGAARNNADCRGILEMLPTVGGKRPGAVLYVEYEREAGDEVRLPPARRCASAGVGAAEAAELWKLRKSAEALLNTLSSTRKPHTFVEDNAVPVENLGRFAAEFKKILARHGTTAAYYAHVSVGVLHVRPLIDLHDEKDQAAMRAISVEVADLARACGGVMSGEHGDGRVRGPLLERFFGAELMGAFAAVKKVFDPAGVLNPGMIVGAGGVETLTENLRVQKSAAARRTDGIETYFDYGSQEGLAGAVEMCNGAGFCRKTAVGTMCPSYRATLDERHSPRGRANALRAAVMPATGAAKFADAATLDTLDLCLSCKACKSECPSNVDVAKLKTEYTAQGYLQNGVPLASRVFGNVRRVNRLGAMMPELANSVLSWRWVRESMRRVLGIAAERHLPPFSKSLYRVAGRKLKGPQKVVLFADCFSTYNESPIGVAAILLLEAFGYQVELPRVGCCGRALISAGLLADARRTAERTRGQLQQFVDDPAVKTVLFLEPSCASAVKDDWLELKMSVPLEQRKKLAAKSFLVEEFLDRFWDQHPCRPQFVPAGEQAVLLHGHCHQKALWGDGTSSRFLRRIVGDKLTVLASGCCGMAGSFGYLAKHYDVSMRIGELSLFGPIRHAAGAQVLAPGTSCRHQIKDGTGRDVLHPVVLAAEMLAKS